MSLLRPVYVTRYGYRWIDAIRAEFWWRFEHSRFTCIDGYTRRKNAEHRAVERRDTTARKQG